VDDNELSVDDLVKIWRSIIVGEHKSWVLFENGTCVIFTNASGDISNQATDLLKEWGPVHVGTSSADFSVVDLADGQGWVVTCHHPDILTYVDPEEIGPAPNELTIGMLGRGMRDDDAHDLHIVHVEQDAV